MDRQLIEEKLEALRHAVHRIREKCPEHSRDLEGNPDLQDIIAMNLARAVQLSVDIAAHLLAASSAPAPATMADAFEQFHRLGALDRELTDRMKRAVGFRNIVVPAYEKIDWAVVHGICTGRVSDFDSFARSAERAAR